MECLLVTALIALVFVPSAVARHLLRERRYRLEVERELRRQARMAHEDAAFWRGVFFGPPSDREET